MKSEFSNKFLTRRISTCQKLEQDYWCYIQYIYLTKTILPRIVNLGGKHETIYRTLMWIVIVVFAFLLKYKTKSSWPLDCWSVDALHITRKCQTRFDSKNNKKVTYEQLPSTIWKPMKRKLKWKINQVRVALRKKQLYLIKSVKDVIRLQILWAITSSVNWYNLKFTDIKLFWFLVSFLKQLGLTDVWEIHAEAMA